MTDSVGAAPAALEAWVPLITARIVICPAWLGCHVAANEPPAGRSRVATGTHAQWLEPS